MYVEKGYYKGWKVRPLIRKDLKYIKRVKGERTIIYNPEYLSRLNKYQELWLLQWIIRSRLIKDPFKCDTLTKNWYLSKGYDMNHIFKLYANTGFISKEMKEARYLNLLNGTLNPVQKTETTLNTIYYKISDFFNSFFTWITGRRADV